VVVLRVVVVVLVVVAVVVVVFVVVVLTHCDVLSNHLHKVPPKTLVASETHKTSPQKTAK